MGWDGQDRLQGVGPPGLHCWQVATIATAVTSNKLVESAIKWSGEKPKRIKEVQSSKKKEPEQAIKERGEGKVGRRKEDCIKHCS